MRRLLLTMGMLNLLTVVGPEFSSAKTIQHGPWEVVLDPSSGDWKSLRWNGTVIAESAPTKMPVDVQVAPGQWLGERRSDAVPAVRHTWDQASATLVLTRRCGDWELAEAIQFGAASNPDRLSRTLRLTYRPAGAKAEPAKFHSVRFRARLPKSGRYLCPTNDPFGSGGLGDLAQQRPSFRTSSGRGVGPLLVEQNSRTLLFINDARRDRASTSLAVVDDEHIEVAHEFQATAWAVPDGGSFTSETAHHGRRCAKVVNTTGQYTLFTQSVRQEKALAGHRVRVTAWVKGERIERGDTSWKVGAVDLSFHLPDGAVQHRSICDLTGTFDWRQVEGTVDVPAEASGLHVRLGLNGATGTMWIDQVELQVVGGP